MPSTLLLQFLITVALCVAGVLGLAFLFATLAPWIQRWFRALIKNVVPNSKN
ncbi:MAG: hypothetical protein WAS25_01455 [Geothrix sp.]|uniref:hypothetical protein n=1 Tax=Geothrix sp. TaxID=1962974 RepID=UPI003BB1F0EA